MTKRIIVTTPRVRAVQSTSLGARRMDPSTVATALGARAWEIWPRRRWLSHRASRAAKGSLRGASFQWRSPRSQGSGPQAKDSDDRFGLERARGTGEVPFRNRARRQKAQNKTPKPRFAACETGLQIASLAGTNKSRQRPTLPHGFPCSTIGSDELNFRVRDGIGCSLVDITTGNLGTGFSASRLDASLRQRAPRPPFWVAAANRNPNPGCERARLVVTGLLSLRFSMLP